MTQRNIVLLKQQRSKTYFVMLHGLIYLGGSLLYDVPRVVNPILCFSVDKNKTGQTVLLSLLPLTNCRLQSSTPLVLCLIHVTLRWLCGWIAPTLAEKEQPKFLSANMLAWQLWILTIFMFIVYVLVNFSKRRTSGNEGLIREANDKAYRANNTNVVWRVTAVSLPPTTPLTCHVGACPSYRSLYNEKMLWQFTHAETHTHEQDSVHTYSEMRIAVSYQSLAAPADTAEAFYTRQNMISPGNTFPFSCFWRETK